MSKSQPMSKSQKTNRARRTVRQVGQLQVQISELEWKGYSQLKIAEKLGISQQMVSHYLRQIEAEVQQRLVPDRVVARQKQIDKVRSLMSTIWDDIEQDKQELEQLPENPSRVKAAGRKSSPSMPLKPFPAKVMLTMRNWLACGARMKCYARSVRC